MEIVFEPKISLSEIAEFVRNETFDGKALVVETDGAKGAVRIGYRTSQTKYGIFKRDQTWYFGTIFTERLGQSDGQSGIYELTAGVNINNWTFHIFGRENLETAGAMAKKISMRFAMGVTVKLVSKSSFTVKGSLVPDD